MKRIVIRAVGIFLLAATVNPFVQAHAQEVQLDKNAIALTSNLIQQDAESSGLLGKVIELNLQKVSLEKALNTISDKGNLKLMYSKKLLPDNKVTLQNKSITIYDALWTVLDNTGLRFAFSQHRQLVLLRMASEEYKNPEKIMPTVSGQVTDATTGESLPGVNVILKGTTTGTSTGSEGRYKLNAPSLQDTLVFSFIGYQTTEIPINGRTTVDVRLQQEIVSGEELVVVGYGTRTKETLTGSVSAVGGEKLEKVPVANVSNSLGGRVPGLITVTGSGEPGNDETTIRIRGNQTLNNNEPLVVIDGVPNRAGGLSRLNPSDIENISVLKDASAAIYGSQAANGVILVTTKRGQEGQQPQFNLKFNQGFSQPTRVPEMADAPTYLSMLNEISYYRGRPMPYSQEEIQKYADPNSDPWLYPNTDWFDEAFKPASYQTKADMSVSGGSESVRYFLSFGGLTEDAFYENSATRYNQYNFRSNIDGQINDFINVQFDVSGRMEDRNFPTVTTWENFRQLMHGKPHLPAYWPNGLPGPDIENGTNPVISTTPATGYDNDERYFFQSKLGLNIDIPGVEGLGVRGYVAFDRNTQSVKEWQTPWILYTFDRSAYMAEKDAGNNPNGGDFLTSAKRGYSEPRLSEESIEGHNILANLVIEYQLDLEDHSVGILLGGEQNTFRNSFITAFRRFFISDQIDQLFAGGDPEKDNNGSASEGARQNVFTRFNYGYKDKYLFEFVGRYDGSYIFPEDKRFGFFPAFSVGWRITEEEFFTNNVGVFDNLKLRASWGQTGNDRIEPYQFLAPYGFGQGEVFGDGSVKPTLFQQRVPNPNVTWEVANQFDIGIDGSILDEKLSFEFDYFDYLREDILWFRNASIPKLSGLTLPRENIGKVKSWGYDGTITYRAQFSNDSFLNISVNGSYARNKIRFFDEPEGIPDWQRNEGSQMNTGLYYIADGIYQTQEEIDNSPHWSGARPGDIIFEDINGDGEITADDRVRIDKNRQPRFVGGLELSGSYKLFDYSLFFQGATGAIIYTQTESGEIGNFRKDFADNRWIGDLDGDGSPDRPSTTEPRTWNRGEEYWASNDNTHFLEDSDYLRLKNVEIGYNLPQRLVEKLAMKRMRVYANGFNLLTFSKLDFIDPEASAGDGIYYPQKRIFNVGVNVTF